VVQWGLPSDREIYIHRAGRTGRAGRAGDSLILYGDDEASELSGLEKEAKIQFAFQDPVRYFFSTFSTTAVPLPINFLIFPWMCIKWLHGKIIDSSHRQYSVHYDIAT